MALHSLKHSPMRIAVPTWAGRVSPVFDVARELLVVDIEQSGPSHREVQPLREDGVRQRVEELAQLGIEVLICGAISRPLEIMLAGAGIRVIAHVCGDSDEVIEAFLNDRLEHNPAHRLPGCRPAGAGMMRRRRGTGWMGNQ